MDELLKSYRETRSQLMGYKLTAPEEEYPVINSMLSDVQFAIDWLQRGHNPAPRRGIHRRSRAQRTIVTDPLRLQSYAQPAACGSPTTISDHERFQIDDALSTLSEREKQAYILHYGLCFSIGQTAKEMGISRGAVETNLKRAKQKVNESKANSLFLYE